MASENPTSEYHQPEATKADALAQRYYGANVSALKELTTSTERTSSVLHPGVLIQPTTNLFALGREQRRDFLNGVTLACIRGYESSFRTGSYEGYSDPSAQRRFSHILSRALQQAIDSDGEIEAASILFRSGKTRDLRNPLVDVGFEYDDWTRENEWQPRLSSQWHKGKLSLVILPGGAIAVNADYGEGMRTAKIANFFDQLPDDLQETIGDIQQVRRESSGRFDIDYKSLPLYPIVDINKINQNIRSTADEFGLHSTLIEPEERTYSSGDGGEVTYKALRPGTLSAQDGIVNVSFNVDTGRLLHLANPDGSLQLGALTNRTHFTEKPRLLSLQYFTPTFIEAGNGKYLYVPQISSDLLKQGIKPGKLSYGLHIAGAISLSVLDGWRDPRYECSTAMWDPEKIQLMKDISASIQQQFSI